MENNNNLCSSNHRSSYGLNNQTIEAVLYALDHDHLLARNILLKLHLADLADLIDIVTAEQQEVIFKILDYELNPELLVELDPVVRDHLIEIFGTEKLSFIKELSIDQAVDVLKDLHPDIKEKLLLHFEPEKQMAITEILSYPENSAGRIMNQDIISIPEFWNVKQILDYLNNTEFLPDKFYNIYVVDAKFKTVGSILMSKIVRTSHESKATEIMDPEVKLINAKLDQEEVAYIFRQYALVSAPVINDEGRLVGVITIEDVVDIVEEEAEEDIMRMVGVTETDIYSAFLDTARHRFPWLFMNLITACLTSFAISVYESTIHSIVALAALMPIVASLGGNAGNQTLTVAVRAIANKNITKFNSRRIIGKEIAANSLNGLLLAVLGGMVVYLWQGDLELTLVFFSAIIINFTIAGFFGSAIPLALNRIGVDPAISSSVFLTTITDMIGFIVFLGLAEVFLI